MGMLRQVEAASLKDLGTAGPPRGSSARAMDTRDGEEGLGCLPSKRNQEGTRKHSRDLYSSLPCVPHVLNSPFLIEAFPDNPIWARWVCGLLALYQIPLTSEVKESRVLISSDFHH